ncbi:MAG: HpcH/HpaI aldolase/citrate lyase family protein [Desulfurispora sp.]|uniref:HpcH/HpaI aldolase/citrate lyase family protein n=1 Tax=Desulfurispora sp. TaxID=3014275 RepID=UPI00404AE4F2
MRSVLFVPGNDEKKAAKALTSQADAVTLDLEDAVAFHCKEQARRTVCRILEKEPARPVFIRVNAADSPHILADLQAVVGLPVRGLMLAKTGSAEQVGKVSWLLGLLEEASGLTTGTISLIPFLETSAALYQAREIAAADRRVLTLALGGVDLSQELGLNYPPESAGLLFARNALVTACAAAGLLPPLDTVWPHLRDTAELTEEARLARRLGFGGKLLIHPAQIEPVHQAFSPTAAEIAYAYRVVKAFEQAEASGRAVIQLDGKMIEYPVVRRYRRLLEIHSPQ